MRPRSTACTRWPAFPPRPSLDRERFRHHRLSPTRSASTSTIWLELEAIRDDRPTRRHQETPMKLRSDDHRWGAIAKICTGCMALAILGNGMFGLLMMPTHAAMQQDQHLRAAQVDRPDRAGAVRCCAWPWRMFDRRPRRRARAALAAGGRTPRARRAVPDDRGDTAQRLVVQFGSRLSAAMVQAVQPAGAGGQERRPGACRA